jgi:hypothetical protein
MQDPEQSDLAESDGRLAERSISIRCRESARQRAKPAGRTVTPGDAATHRTRIAGTDDSAARWFVRDSRGFGREQSRRSATDLCGLLRESPWESVASGSTPTTAQAVVGVAAFLGFYGWLTGRCCLSLEDSPRDMDREGSNGVDPVYLVVGGTTVVLVIVMVLLLF